MKVQWTRELTAELLSRHATLRSAGAEVGVTAERVRQVAKRFGLSPHKKRLAESDRWVVNALPIATSAELLGLNERYLRSQVTRSLTPLTWAGRCARRTVLPMHRDGETQIEISRWLSCPAGFNLHRARVALFIIEAGKGIGRNRRFRGHRPARAEDILALIDERPNRPLFGDER